MFKHKLSANKQQNLPNSQLSFNIPHSKYQSKLYKIFYFNENRNEWIFDKNSFEQFSNDKKITVEFANTPLVCFIDSNEKEISELLAQIDASIINVGSCSTELEKTQNDYWAIEEVSKFYEYYKNEIQTNDLYIINMYIWIS